MSLLFMKVRVNDLLELSSVEIRKHNLPHPTLTVIESVRLYVKDSRFEFSGEYNE